MTLTENIHKFLPLSESTYYVMLALVAPMHGYAVMQRIEALSEGAIKVGPGTLYGVFSTLEQQNLIVKVSEEERRKVFTLTALGKKVLAAQIQRLKIMARSGEEILPILLIQGSPVETLNP